MVETLNAYSLFYIAKKEKIEYYHMLYPSFSWIPNFAERYADSMYGGVKLTGDNRKVK
jgi:hypothetical protein